MRERCELCGYEHEFIDKVGQFKLYRIISRGRGNCRVHIMVPVEEGA